MEATTKAASIMIRSHISRIPRPGFVECSDPNCYPAFGRPHYHASAAPETLPEIMKRRQTVQLESENTRLRLIVNTIIPAIGGFDPADNDQVEKIALAWCARWHAMRARLKELDPEFEA